MIGPTTISSDCQLSSSREIFVVGHQNWDTRVYFEEREKKERSGD